MCCLLEQKAHGSNLDISVLACSKGAEVYSVAWTIRSARPDLKLRIHAVDISQEILEFAEKGVYSLSSGLDVTKGSNDEGITNRGDMAWNTARDQNAPMFERLTDKEVEAMFEIEGDQASEAWLREESFGSAGMRPIRACPSSWSSGHGGGKSFSAIWSPRRQRCLRNVARLVEPGGHLFVSGIDLDVRTRLAYEMGWKPVAL
jgi:hypothetical protein